MSGHILDHPLISERYFFPRRARIRSPFRVDCGDAELNCFFHQRSFEAKTLLHFHGNGEIVNDYFDDFVDRVDGMGFNCFLAEYRGYGMSTGSPQLQKMLEDVERILVALGQPPEKIVLFGRSVGSIFAIHGVSRFPSVSGLILESGIADPLERLLLRIHPEELGATMADLENAALQWLDHRMKLSQYRGPVLIMHSRFDGLVEADNAARLHNWAGGSKKLKIFDIGDHNSIMALNDREYFQLVENFLKSWT